MLKALKILYQKFKIALKETNETEFWLELLVETDYLTKKEFGQHTYTDCVELKDSYFNN